MSPAALRDAVAAEPADAAVYVSLPAPHCEPEALWALAPPGPAFLFAPSDDETPAVVGLGAAATLRPTGPERLPWLRQQAELLRGLRRRGEGPPPRLCGALAFTDGPARAPWLRFGEGLLLLPRWTYVRSGDRAWLGLALLPGDEPAAARAAAAAAELEVLLAGLAAPRAAQGSLAATELPPPQPQDLASWRRQIDAIRAAIHAGRFQKIVAARRTVQPLPAPVSIEGVLRALAAGQPGTTRFALRCGDETFLGATPERLLRKRGRELSTEALAGSLPSGAAGGGAALLARPKDRAEHALVVSALRERLAPLCERISCPDQPEIRALRQILHLRTPVRGLLREDVHPFDLIAALHPTPAVGGLPRAAAERWIVAEEPAPRGLYAGPVGHCDAAGDADFMVGIRSALVQPDVAHVYGGAGIMGDSDAEDEYHETALKQEALLGALRIAAQVIHRGAGPS